MEYYISGNSNAHTDAVFTIRNNQVGFGITNDATESPNPAELLFGAFAACCLKNIERFSEILKFDYKDAQIKIIGKRQNSPSKLIEISYTILINSQDQCLKPSLLHKNIKKYGTIYNTLKETCKITGEIKLK